MSSTIWVGSFRSQIRKDSTCNNARKFGLIGRRREERMFAFLQTLMAVLVRKLCIDTTRWMSSWSASWLILPQLLF